MAEIESNWDFYFTRVNDLLSSIFVDLGLRKHVPLSGEPWLLWIWVHFNSPPPDGLSSDAEAPTLYKIEEALVAALEKACAARFVGRITGDSRREFYFYGNSALKFEKAVQLAMSGFSEYRHEFDSQEDPEWRQYLDLLYPSDRDRQRISNRHVIEELEKLGDLKNLARPVDHWLYFPTQSARDDCKAKILEKGFSIVAENEDEEDDERRFSLQIMRSDPVDWDHVNEVTLDLDDIASACGGDYDGWECPVTKTEKK